MPVGFGQVIEGRLKLLSPRQTAVPGVFNVTDADQVWSLTPFYSVYFSQSRIGVKKCVFNKHTIKVSRQLLLTVSWDLRA